MKLFIIFNTCSRHNIFRPLFQFKILSLILLTIKIIIEKKNSFEKDGKTCNSTHHSIFLLSTSIWRYEETWWLFETSVEPVEVGVKTISTFQTSSSPTFQFLRHFAVKMHLLCFNFYCSASIRRIRLETKLKNLCHQIIFSLTAYIRIL